jgi:hypothetical protein
MMAEAAKTEIHHTIGRATMTLTDVLLALPAASETRAVIVLPPRLDSPSQNILGKG